MNINAAIIDQRLSSLMDEIRPNAENELGLKGDDGRLKSLAFVFLSVKVILDLSNEEAFDCLTEDGQDFGVDAIHISEVTDNEFTVSLFQGKYKKSLDGESQFPESGVKQLIHATRQLFDPGVQIRNINKRLEVRVETVRSLIRDGCLPQVRAIASNNGLKWNASANDEIERAAFGDQVSFEHCNHDRLLTLLQTTKQVDETLNFSGKAIVEEFNFSRVFVGRIAVSEIAALMERHGESLLERNIRRYLGLKGNRVNEEIRKTLMSEEENANFYFYNNGIALTCDKFSHNGLQSENHKVKIDNLQIINGGQTCMTIFKTLTKEQPTLFDSHENAFVLARLYELPSEHESLVRRIILAANSQNPVDLKDLRANDDIQRRLETDIKQLGFQYRRKRSDASLKPSDISSGVAVEAILAVWRKKPHQAKFHTHEHFGKLYYEIFSNDLSGAQTVAAVLLYRIAENHRKRQSPEDKPFTPYASCFIAMQMGERLLKALEVKTLSDFDHRRFLEAKNLIYQNGEKWFQASSKDIEEALTKLYGKREVSAQQLAATFRRGDLIEMLENESSEKIEAVQSPKSDTDSKRTVGVKRRRKA